MQISLSEEDRGRLGGPEWLEYDPLHLSTEDAEALETAGGDWTSWGTFRVAGVRAGVWWALRNAGIELDYDKVTFDIRDIRVTRASLGKALSGTSDSPTPGPSAAPTRASRRKPSPSST